jgi:hypothetical protein
LLVAREDASTSSDGSASAQDLLFHEQVASTERSANWLVRDLRLLPSKQALALRGEVAAAAAEARQQRMELDKSIHSLAKKGI